MAELNYTQGEWKMYGECTIVDDNGNTIALVARNIKGLGGELSLQQRTANARLIAAAPEMYQALQNVHDAIENGIALQGIHFYKDEMLAIGKVLAAIDGEG